VCWLVFLLLAALFSFELFFNLFLVFALINAVLYLFFKYACFLCLQGYYYADIVLIGVAVWCTAKNS
jgi:hypothetical protein